MHFAVRGSLSFCGDISICTLQRVSTVQSKMSLSSNNRVWQQPAHTLHSESTVWLSHQDMYGSGLRLWVECPQSSIHLSPNYCGYISEQLCWNGHIQLVSSLWQSTWYLWAPICVALHTCILYCRMLETEEVVKHMKISVGTNRKVVLVRVGVATAVNKNTVVSLIHRPFLYYGDFTKACM